MNFKIQPWSHQLEAIDLAAHRNEFALFMEQGTGKTPTAINILRAKYQQNQRVLNTLILCPQIVIENWKKEFLAHSEVPESFVHCIRGSDRQRAELARQALRLSRDTGGQGQILITNYEAVLMKDFYQVLLNEFAPVAIVLDESHKIKSMESIRTRAVLALGRKAQFRYILSGTPVVNSVFDIFSQFLFLDKGETFGEKFYGFRGMYFKDVNAAMPRHCYFPDWQLREGSLDEINKRIYRKAYRKTKAECLDLPPLVRQIIEVPLTNWQTKVYRAMERDAVATVNEKTISADLAIKKALRLQQIVTGFVTEDSGEIEHIPHSRINILEEVIETIPLHEKFIIWATFKQNYIEIRELLNRLKIAYGEIHGDVSGKIQQAAVNDINNPSSGMRAVIAHPASGGTGVNLTGASYAIFYSRNFNWGDDNQAESRNHRGGSEVHRKITRIDLVSPGTTDEIVLLALRDKKDVSEEVLKHLKKGKYVYGNGSKQ
jgi:SNF2 family DNA or RNA helicase